MVLVVGATGLLGSEICKRLKEAGKAVRALARPTADRGRVESLRALGVQLFNGDLKDRASLDAICEDVDAVISTASTTFSRQPGDTIESVDLEGQLNLIAAARAAGVRRFVFVSVSGHIDVACPLIEAKRAVEQELMQSGLTYAILRPSFFMEVWLTAPLGFDAPNRRAQVYGSGEEKVSFISYRDVAQFAVDGLDNTLARNAIIELGGPQALSQLDVVRIFEESTGKSFEVQHVPEDALEAQRAGSSDPLQQSFAALMLAYARGDAIDMAATLARLPRKLTSVRDFADRETRA